MDIIVRYILYLQQKGLIFNIEEHLFKNIILEETQFKYLKKKSCINQFHQSNFKYVFD